MTPRELARRVLDRVDKGAWATPALDGELERAGLEERDRRLASELVYGVLRHRTRIDRALATHADLRRTPPKVVTALRVAAYQLVFLDRVPAYAAVDDAVAAAREVGGAKLAGFANAVLRKLADTGEPALPELGPDASLDDRLARLEIECSIPRWILDELTAAVRGATDAEGRATHDARAARVGELAAAFAEQPPLIARVSPHVSRDALVETMSARGVTATPVEITPSALRLDGLGDPSRDPDFAAGRFTIQDAGAQLVAHVAAPSPGARILDACAGVGGKATHLAELTGDGATIDAADLSATKLGLLADTARRLHLSSIHTHVCDLLDTAATAALAPTYDLIVLDAPCSGLGVLRRHPDAKWRLQPDAVKRLAALQRQLLDAMVARLAPDGTLVYAVCTFTRAEGPDQIAAFAKRTGLRVVDERRTWPPDADAFYIAKLTRDRRFATGVP